MDINDQTGELRVGLENGLQPSIPSHSSLNELFLRFKTALYEVLKQTKPENGPFNKESFSKYCQEAIITLGKIETIRKDEMAISLSHSGKDLVWKASNLLCQYYQNPNRDTRSQLDEGVRICAKNLVQDMHRFDLCLQKEIANTLTFTVRYGPFVLPYEVIPILSPLFSIVRPPRGARPKLFELKEDTEQKIQSLESTIKIQENKIVDFEIKLSQEKDHRLVAEARCNLLEMQKERLTGDINKVKQMLEEKDEKIVQYMKLNEQLTLAQRSFTETTMKNLDERSSLVNQSYTQLESSERRRKEVEKEVESLKNQLLLAHENYSSISQSYRKSIEEITILHNQRTEVMKKMEELEEKLEKAEERTKRAESSLSTEQSLRLIAELGRVKAEEKIKNLSNQDLSPSSLSSPMLRRNIEESSDSETLSENDNSHMHSAGNESDSLGNERQMMMYDHSPNILSLADQSSRQETMQVEGTQTTLAQSEADEVNKLLPLLQSDDDTLRIKTTENLLKIAEKKPNMVPQMIKMLGVSSSSSSGSNNDTSNTTSNNNSNNTNNGVNDNLSKYASSAINRYARRSLCQALVLYHVKSVKISEDLVNTTEKLSSIVLLWKLAMDNLSPEDILLTDSDQLSCFLPLFVRFIKTLQTKTSSVPETSQLLIFNSIIHRLHLSPYHAQLFYWIGTNDKIFSDAVFEDTTSLCVWFLSPPLGNSRNFFMSLKKNFKDLTVGYTNNTRLDIVDPFQPEVRLRINKVEVVKVLESKSRPLLIEFTMSNNSKSKVILKLGDDLRKDMFIQTMFEVFNSLWSKSNLVDKPFLFTYKCLPLTEDYGFIQFVENAKSVNTFDWSKLKSMSNQDKLKFICSAAGSFIGSWVLGIRDRHQDNMLIKDDNVFFHIDFGHLFNNKPLVDAPRISIPEHMQQNLTDAEWQLFTDICGNGFEVLYQNGSMIRQLCLLLFEKVDNPLLIEDFLGGEKSLMLSKPLKQARMRFLKQIASGASKWNIKRNLKYSAHNAGRSNEVPPRKEQPLTPRNKLSSSGSSPQIPPAHSGSNENDQITIEELILETTHKDISTTRLAPKSKSRFS
eukprot:TRINITY_DN6186_c0_g1_i1.p1 TRINITY_DN6186_c0_g1~~TRINITY_DN6186_c0_g1_i1.p1  ORF type:complete len:1077 (-),score=225.92 TRINITY_DN6186_c0_g1_i1:285-3515(-)